MISGKSLCNLNFLTFLNKGRTYVRAYENRWVPKQTLEDGTQVGGYSKAKEQHQVGALLSDNRVKISPKFIKKFPDFAGVTWFYLNNDLVDDETYYNSTPDEVPMQIQPHDNEQADAPIIEDDDEADEEIPEPKSKFFLAHYALSSLAYQTGVTKTLKDVFGKKEGGQLLDFILYKLLDGRAAEQYPQWAFHQYLSPASTELDGRKISRLLQLCSKEKWDEFWKLRFEQSQKRQAQVDGIRRVRFCALDSTSISTDADLDDAEHGKAKQNPEKKQINLLMVMDQLTGDLIYAFTYNGSINDVSTYTYVVDRMTSIGFPMNEIMLITDRGYGSTPNINKLLNDKQHFLTGVVIGKGTVEERWITKEVRDLIDRPETWNSLNQVNQITKTESWKLKDGSCVNTYAHIYYDPDIAKERIKGLNNLLACTMDALNKKKKVDEQQMKEARPYLRQIEDPDSNPHMVAEKKWVFNNAAIVRFQKRAGFLILKSDIIADPSCAIAMYRLRNTVEIGFDQLKNELEGRRLLVRQRSHLGKLLVFIIGMGLRMRIRFNYDHHIENNPASRMRIPGNSVKQLLGELDKVTIHRNRKSEKWLLDMVPRKMRDWLAALFYASTPPAKFD